MPWAVAVIAVTAYLAGVATANRAWSTAGWLIAASVGVAWWLRHRVKFHIEERFYKAAEYIVNTRHQMQTLKGHEVSEVPADSDLTQIVARIRAGLDGEEEETDDT